MINVSTFLRDWLVIPSVLPPAIPLSVWTNHVLFVCLLYVLRLYCKLSVP